MHYTQSLILKWVSATVCLSLFSRTYAGSDYLTVALGEQVPSCFAKVSIAWWCHFIICKHEKRCRYKTDHNHTGIINKKQVILTTLPTAINL